MVRMKEKNLKSVVEKAQCGDEEAFQELYMFYKKQAYYLALKITNCDADANDVVQDTFIQINRSLSSLRDPMLFKSWMSRIVVSKCNRIFAKNRYSTIDPEILANSNKVIERNIEANPKKFLNKKNEEQILMKLLGEMKPKHREVLVLSYFCQYKQSEIAEMLDISVNTIKSRTMYAKDELKQLVESYEHHNDYRFHFRSDALGTVLVTAFAREFQSMAGTSALSSFKNTQSFVASHLVTTIACVSIVGLLITGGTYAFIQSRLPHPNKQVPNQSVVESVSYGQETFSPIIYKNKEYKTSKDAYYALILWANTPELLQDKTQEEINEAKTLYSALKVQNNAYYKLLVQKELAPMFENL